MIRALAFLTLAACSPQVSQEENDGRACWRQHHSYELCYAKCAALNPRYHVSASLCVGGVDAEASLKGAA
jgi:hypothetical protein